MENSLDPIFKPQSIALIGASSKEGNVGHAILQNLIKDGFEGEIYPVNPQRKEVLHLKCYPSIAQVPAKVDLAVIVTPAKTIPDIVKACGESGVKGLLIISAGFKEAGPEGQRMSDEIVSLARAYNMRVVGPNCLGIISPLLNLNASFAGTSALPGKIAFISQSGALCTAILDWAEEQRVGFSHFVSIGSMIDVGFHDLIDYFGQDPSTSSIVIYMESMTQARKFLSAARAYARNKPIIVLKVGKSTEGAQAARSHTGTLAGNDAVFDAAFKRAGIVRVNTMNELFNCAQALAMQPRPKGNRLAIVTNAGGPGVIATDYLIQHRGKLAQLSSESIDQLNKVLPAAWSHGNPIDVLGDADPEKYKVAVEVCLRDPAVDGVLVLLTPQAMTDATAIAKILTGLGHKGNKTLLTSWMGDRLVKEGQEILEQAQIPGFRVPEDAVACFLYMHQYSRNLELLYETPDDIPRRFSPDVQHTKELIRNIIAENRNTLTEYESKRLLSYYDFPVAENGLARNETEAAQLGAQLGFPLAMKISSPDILHKTDVGGVRLNIANSEEAKKVYQEIIKSAKKHMPDAQIQGVFMERMISKPIEVILGAKRDPIFGPTIVFGTGGVAVEIYKDINIGLPPLNMALAERIIEETKIYTLLNGYRGMPGVDMPSLKFLLYKLAYLLMDFPEIKDIDINPLSLDDKSGVVVDAKIILDDEVKSEPKEKYSHLVISPYPKEYVTSHTLKDGRKVILRPIRPEDEPLEMVMFENFSERTKRFRFFGNIKEITHEQRVRFTQNDYDREIAIIVEIEENQEKKMAGVVRIIADAYNETAEFAIVIADPWHHLGLGNKLTDTILEIARERNIGQVYAHVLHDNDAMLHMLRKRGFATQERNQESCQLTLDLAMKPNEMQLVIDHD